MANLIIYDHYSIAGHFAPAIVNGDYSGLSDDDDKALAVFLKSVPPGIWQFSENTEFARDQVTGLHADCLLAELWVDANNI